MNFVTFRHEYIDTIEQTKCEICKEEEAIVYCRNDQINLCDTCDIDLHEDHKEHKQYILW